MARGRQIVDKKTRVEPVDASIQVKDKIRVRKDQRGGGGNRGRGTGRGDAGYEGKTLPYTRYESTPVERYLPSPSRPMNALDARQLEHEMKQRHAPPMHEDIEKAIIQQHKYSTPAPRKEERHIQQSYPMGLPQSYHQPPQQPIPLQKSDSGKGEKLSQWQIKELLSGTGQGTYTEKLSQSDIRALLSGQMGPGKSPGRTSIPRTPPTQQQWAQPKAPIGAMSLPVSQPHVLPQHPTLPMSIPSMQSVPHMPTAQPQPNLLLQQQLAAALLMQNPMLAQLPMSMFMS